jgi:uroporphyrinogen decarboxylase
VDSRERILTTLQGGVPDRVGRYEYFWSETLERWRSEGMPADVDPGDLFCLDLHLLPRPDLSFQFPDETLEETGEQIVRRDSNGVTAKWLKGGEGHPPHWLDYKLKTPRDWYEHKERLVCSDDRIPSDTRAEYDAARTRGKFVVFNSNESFIPAWNAVGQVAILMMMAEEPEVAKDMFMTYADLLIALAENVRAMGVEVDGAWFRGDMAYNKGPMFSPAMYDELLLPAHRRLCDYFRSYGKPVMLHTDGKIDMLIPRFIDAGFSAIHPLEAKCDQDVRVLKEVYGGQITFFGNIDARVLSGTKEAIEEEVRSKVTVAAKGGGYIFHSDHSIPPSVSYDNYLFALDMLGKYGAY